MHSDIPLRRTGTVFFDGEVEDERLPPGLYEAFEGRVDGVHLRALCGRGLCVLYENGVPSRIAAEDSLQKEGILP